MPKLCISVRYMLAGLHIIGLPVALSVYERDECWLILGWLIFDFNKFTFQQVLVLIFWVLLCLYLSVSWDVCLLVTMCLWGACIYVCASGAWSRANPWADSLNHIHTIAPDAVNLSLTHRAHATFTLKLSHTFMWGFRLDFKHTDTNIQFLRFINKCSFWLDICDITNKNIR